ncbi:hypothetical protein [Methylorubrum populi]|uniref:Uncharacterized protein n=1 Tax=Methylorubrum populi TaxID=223967 RepID=A0A833J0R1_9HYPH|nr:hypothetical protein [Methylorubrum populi]KAB7782410.1 hypothetical protein F8B43_5165 [Methylorubrum populi]
MSDLSKTIVPRSDQLNADDLITGPRTIRITEVVVKPGQEQPASIFFEGDNDKPYKPGLSMRRVIVRAWGLNHGTFAGRRMTLYRDDTVKFGGVAVGGIRISHMSDIEESITLPLSENRKTRKPFTVRPLAAERGLSGGKPNGEDTRTKLLRIAREKAALGHADLDAWLDKLSAQHRAVVDEIEAELRDRATDADDRPPPEDNDFHGFAPADEEVA